MSKKLDDMTLSVLEKERKQTRTELDRLRDALKTEVEIEDMEEAAFDLIERDKTQALIFTLERKLEEIKHAIKRAQEQTYGICESCGQEIEPERLEIFPETTLCIRCKRQREKQRSH